jgi:hypothetical protein
MYTESDESGGPTLQTGVAIANPLPSDQLVDLELSNLEGWTVSRISLPIPGNGHFARFLHELPGFESVPRTFQGVLKVTSSPAGSIAVSGFRVRQNERQETITTTISVVAESTAGGSERFFPVFADGGGYATQFVMFGGLGQAGSGSLFLFAARGEAVP